MGDGQTGSLGAGGAGGGNNGDIVGGGGSNFIASEGAGRATGVDADNNGNGRVTLSYVPGNTDCAQAPLTIVKQVAGSPLPEPGTMFKVQVQCLDASIDLGLIGHPEIGSSVELTYTVDANRVAQPAAGHTISFVGQNQCAVLESDSGGAASTTYACSGSGAVESGAAAAESWGVSGEAVVAPGDPCTTSGPLADPIAVNILAPRQEATVTVQNAFAAAAAAVTPRFTG